MPAQVSAGGQTGSKTCRRGRAAPSPGVLGPCALNVPKMAFETGDVIPTYGPQTTQRLIMLSVRNRVKQKNKSAPLGTLSILSAPITLSLVFW